MAHPVFAVMGPVGGPPATPGRSGFLQVVAFHRRPVKGAAGGGHWPGAKLWSRASNTNKYSDHLIKMAARVWV